MRVVCGITELFCTLHGCDIFGFRGPRNPGKKNGFDSSLRRHYPDQVLRVDGSRAILSAGSYPSSPLENLDPIQSFKNWPKTEKLSSHSVSLKKYLGELGHPPSCGLGLDAAS